MLSGRGVLRIDDCLPTRGELEAMGLTVRGDYDLESLRSFEMADDEDPGTDDDRLCC